MYGTLQKNLPLQITVTRGQHADRESRTRHQICFHAATWSIWTSSYFRKYEKFPISCDYLVKVPGLKRYLKQPDRWRYGKVILLKSFFSDRLLIVSASPNTIAILSITFFDNADDDIGHSTATWLDKLAGTEYHYTNFQNDFLNTEICFTCKHSDLFPAEFCRSHCLQRRQYGLLPPTIKLLATGMPCVRTWLAWHQQTLCIITSKYLWWIVARGKSTD